MSKQTGDVMFDPYYVSGDVMFDPYYVSGDVMFDPDAEGAVRLQ